MIEARLATPSRLIGYFNAMWEGPCGESTFHIARKNVGPRKKPPSLHNKAGWDWVGECERCGEPIAWNPGGEDDVSVSSGVKIIWDTPSGTLEPGCLYWEDASIKGQHWCSGNWTNCDKRHLYAVLPNGHHWDIDSRARNCGLPQDRVHRCWCRSGAPPNVTVNKACVTCNAGAGSIIAGDYHGFLTGGQFT